LKLSDRKIGKFLFAVQGIGAVFVGIFLTAYLGGLPSTAVLHSEPTFRIPLFILGAVLVFLLLSAFVPVLLSEE
jgi:hypothetical protein